MVVPPSPPIEVMGSLDTDFLEFQFAHHFFYFDFKAKHATSPWTGGAVKSIAQISVVFTVFCGRNSANSNHAGRTTLTDKIAMRRAKKRPLYAVNMERAYINRSFKQIILLPLLS
ncbi:hypothetical protein SDC9_211613 [bioreactor metagenome]|uniref:Uncharacterized protein n=1 Tax=bioreactor metagenome TaxID=1076179 RepID=A0A645JK99_9ZZZZ